MKCLVCNKKTNEILTSRWFAALPFYIQFFCCYYCPVNPTKGKNFMFQNKNKWKLKVTFELHLIYINYEEYLNIQTFLFFFVFYT